MRGSSSEARQLACRDQREWVRPGARNYWVAHQQLGMASVLAGQRGTGSAPHSHLMHLLLSPPLSTQTHAAAGVIQPTIKHSLEVAPTIQHPNVNVWPAVTYLEFSIRICFSATVSHPIPTSCWAYSSFSDTELRHRTLIIERDLGSVKVD